MRLKYTLILAVLILSFGFTTTSGINTVVESLKYVSEFETDNPDSLKDTRLVLDDGSVMNCSFQTRKTTVRNFGNKGLAVSVSSNWKCK